MRDGVIFALKLRCTLDWEMKAWDPALAASTLMTLRRVGHVNCSKIFSICVRSVSKLFSITPHTRERLTVGYP